MVRETRPQEQMIRDTICSIFCYVAAPGVARPSPRPPPQAARVGWESSTGITLCRPASKARRPQGAVRPSMWVAAKPLLELFSGLEMPLSNTKGKREGNRNSSSSGWSFILHFKQQALKQGHDRQRVRKSFRPSFTMLSTYTCTPQLSATRRPYEATAFQL